MKTFSHSWQYLAELFLEWKMLQIEGIEKIKTHDVCSIALFRKWYHLWDDVEKYGVREATDDNMIRRVRFACWIRKATREHAYEHAHAHTEIRIIAFPQQPWFVNARQCYVIRTLPILFTFASVLVWCPGFWHCIVLWVDTDISEVNAESIVGVKVNRDAATSLCRGVVTVYVGIKDKPRASNQPRD